MSVLAPCAAPEFSLPLVINCRPSDLSFAELCNRFWRVKGAGLHPLHQVCAIARRLDVDILVVEEATGREDIDTEIAALHASNKVANGVCEALALSFFRSGKNDPGDRSTIRRFLARESKRQLRLDVGKRAAAYPGTFLGQVILVNYYSPSNETEGASYIYEALLTPPPEMVPNPGTRIKDSRLLLQEFETTVLGSPFWVQAAYYCQQNGITNGCGHAAIRSIVTTPDARITSAQIDDVSDTASLEPMAVKTVMRIPTLLSRVEALSRPRSYPVPFGDLPTDREAILANLVGSLESGRPALLSHNTAYSQPVEHQVESSTIPCANEAETAPEALPPSVDHGATSGDHVVAVVGYIADRNLWHPQAIQAYNEELNVEREKSGPPLRSSSWVRHLIVHDDNFGPYRALGIRSFPMPEPNNPEGGQLSRPYLVPQTPIGIFCQPVQLWPTLVQWEAARLLRSFQVSDELKALKQVIALHVETQTNELQPLSSMRLHDWVSDFFDHSADQILRPILMSKDPYVGHLATVPDKCGNRASKAELDWLRRELPTSPFWMVELSHTLLFTGIDSKIGELLIGESDAHSRSRTPSRWWMIRLPHQFVRVTRRRAIYKDSALTSHMPAWHHPVYG